MVKFLSATENSSEIADLKSEIISKRPQGEVLFEIKQVVADEPTAASRSLTAMGDDSTKLQDVTEIIDSFVTQMGYSSLGEDWKEIDQAEAQKIINFIMTKDLAYAKQFLTTQEAEQTSAKLLNAFPQDCRYFTNASFTSDYSRLSEWAPLTEATFDTGVVMVSDERIGMLWVKDED